jgi:hypothetical protein
VGGGGDTKPRTSKTFDVPRDRVASPQDCPRSVRSLRSQARSSRSEAAFAACVGSDHGFERASALVACGCTALASIICDTLLAGEPCVSILRSQSLRCVCDHTVPLRAWRGRRAVHASQASPSAVSSVKGSLVYVRCMCRVCAPQGFRPPLQWNSMQCNALPKPCRHCDRRTHAPQPLLRRPHNPQRGGRGGTIKP